MSYRDLLGTKFRGGTLVAVLLVAGGAVTSCDNGSDSPIGPSQIAPMTLEMVRDVESDWHHAGDTISISWTSSADPARGFAVVLSLDSAKTFTQSLDSAVGAQIRSYRWAVPGDMSGAWCVLRITARNGLAPLSIDTRPFALNKYYRITTDLRDKTYPPGGSFTVTWEADTAMLSNGTVVEISADLGRSWLPVQFEEALDKDETSLIVFLPDEWEGAPIDSVKALIRVHEYDYNDHSDIAGPFTIKK